MYIFATFYIILLDFFLSVIIKNVFIYFIWFLFYNILCLFLNFKFLLHFFVARQTVRYSHNVSNLSHFFRFVSLFSFLIIQFYSISVYFSYFDIVYYKIKHYFGNSF